MGRYHVKWQSATAVAVDISMAFLMCPAGSGFNLKRVDASLITVGSASAPPDQNCVLGITPSTGGPTGAPSNTGTVALLNQNYPAAVAIAATSYATTAPTVGASATDPYQISCSSRGGGILNWEQPDEWQVLKGVTNGIVFVNRVNALTTPLAWVIDVEWEELSVSPGQVGFRTPTVDTLARCQLSESGSKTGPYWKCSSVMRTSRKRQQCRGTWRAGRVGWASMRSARSSATCTAGSRCAWDCCPPRHRSAVGGDGGVSASITRMGTNSTVSVATCEYADVLSRCSIRMTGCAARTGRGTGACLSWLAARGSASRGWPTCSIMVRARTWAGMPVRRKPLWRADGGTPSILSVEASASC